MRRCGKGWAALLTLWSVLVACGGQQSPTASGSPPPATLTSTAVAHGGQPDGECAAVEQIAPDSAEGQEIGAALLAALPATQSAELQRAAPYAFDEVWSIAKAGSSALVQASFKAALEPGIFVLEATPNGYRYVGLGWGGMPESAAIVRSSLADKLPAADRALAACVDLSRWNIS